MNAEQLARAAFVEAVERARSLWADESKREQFEREFAALHGYQWLHTGGGIYVAARRVTDEYLVAVSDECVCLYVVPEDAREQRAGQDALHGSDAFFSVEDPWLVAEVSQ